MHTQDLQPIHDSIKSFYGKAVVKTTGNRKTLISYSTEVAYIENDIAVVNDTYSSTTLRHIKEFLQQNGFPVGNKAFIIKNYMEESK